MSGPRRSGRYERSSSKPDQSERLVDLLVGDVLGNRSVSLARPDDGITEPAVLRRSDGTSVYTVAGSDLFTSTRILDAEQRLVDHRRAATTAVQYLQRRSMRRCCRRPPTGSP